MSPLEPFLVDKANARLVAWREGAARAPRAVGLRKTLHLLNKTGMPFFFALLSCVFVLLMPVAIALFVWGVLLFRREYRLHRHGQVIVGEIVSFGEVKYTGYEQGPEGTVGAPTSWLVPTIGFSFPTPDGRVLAGSAGIHPRTPADMPPRPGEPMAVLYLDDGNYQVL